MAASSSSRRPAAKKTAARSNVRALSDTPGKVDFNLDTYEREGEIPEPFSMVVAGRRITLADPHEMPWQDLADIDDPFEVVDKFMTPADAKFFLEQRIEAFKLQGFMRAFQTHYGIGTPGNVAG